MTYRTGFHLVFLTPLMQMAFLTGIGTAKTKSISEGVAISKKQIKPTLQFAYPYFTLPVLSMYSGMIPLRFGNLYMDSFNIGWAIILSYVSNNY